jgi:hypothetical protein
MEKSSIMYSALGRVVREGGFKIALIVRYSVIPSHCMSSVFFHLKFVLHLVYLVTTAIFAVCGMNIFVFILAAALSLPQQFINVYIGTLLESSANCMFSTKAKIHILTCAFSVHQFGKYDCQ